MMLPALLLLPVVQRLVLQVKVQQLSDDVQYQVIARGKAAATSEDGTVLRDYFNLQACLKDLCQEWSDRDERFNKIHAYFPGARVLRQDPVECLFEFICSSNNHISRIHGMVERLCRDYGTPLPHSSLISNAPAVKAEGSEAEEWQPQQQSVPDLAFYAFPTLEQLSAASEAALRAEGFGYRAKFITGTVQALLAKPGGGQQWLLSLRDIPYKEASEALCQLSGIGPKVAACICLFALDKHEAIPVDTHVWQLAVRYYTPHLKGKTMNKKIMVAVEQAFIDRFGPWAGWAHNTLFISELASQRDRLPLHLQPGVKTKQARGPKAAKVDAAGVDDHGSLELSRLAASSSTTVGSSAPKKQKPEAGKDQAQLAEAQGRVDSSDATKSGDPIPHDIGLDHPDKKLPKLASRSTSKPKPSRRSAAHPGDTKQTRTFSSIVVAAAAAVDQAVVDGADATQRLVKRKR
ncbi:hypothetical protein ABBQ32_005027 [Trebouxia sp. C0010 RCD-2024]